jgi:hypothetical protein
VISELTKSSSYEVSELYALRSSIAEKRCSDEYPKGEQALLKLMILLFAFMLILNLIFQLAYIIHTPEYKENRLL